MNPTEKAVQLFNKYYVSILEINHDLSEEVIISILAKKQALIAVTEITKQCWSYRDIDLQVSYDYWIEVKNEIEKL